MPIIRGSDHRRATLRTSVLSVIAAIVLGGWSDVPAEARQAAFSPLKYYIPSRSMEPTLRAGEYVFASSTAEPKRGQVVVYRLPRDPSTVFIKRIVGMPGDRIQMVGGVLHVNGEAVKRERVADFEGRDFDDRPIRVRQFRETLPNGVSYLTLDEQDKAFLDNTAVYTVSPDHLFVLGDNRDNSSDSRVATHGFIPTANVIARVSIVYFSILEGESIWKVWRLPFTVRWSRLFTFVE